VPGLNVISVFAAKKGRVSKGDTRPRKDRNRSSETVVRDTIVFFPLGVLNLDSGLFRVFRGGLFDAWAWVAKKPE